MKHLMKLGIRLGFLVQWLAVDREGNVTLAYGVEPTEVTKDFADQFVTEHNEQITEWDVIILPTESNNEPNHVATP